MENSEINIAIIKTNDFEFNQQLYYKNLSKLQDDITQFIEIKKILFSDMMEYIVTSINLTPELIGHTPTCHETATCVYQVCYVGTENNNSTSSPNNICSYLTGEKVYGNAVFLSSRISQLGTCVPNSTHMDDIANILYSKFVHKGIYVSTNDNQDVIEFDYFKHPIEYYNITNEDDLKNYNIKDIEFMGFSLCMVLESSSSILNKRATRIFGTQKVKGDVLIISKSPHEYYDLTHAMYKKIQDLSYGTLKSRELDEEEKQEGKLSNGLPVINNKYVILEKRYDNFKKKGHLCFHCNNKFVGTELTCTGCYRVKYHTVECQKDSWDTHKKECLYNKD